MNLILLCPKYSVDDKIHSSNVVKIRKKESKGVHWTIFEWFFTKKGLFLGFCGIVDDVSDIIFHIIALILLNFLAKRRKKGRFGWTTAAIFCLKYNVRHGCLLLLLYFYCFIESLKQTTTVPYFLDALVASSLTQENQIQAKSAQNQYLRQVLASCF